MSSHPAAVAVLLPAFVILQVGCRVCTHGGKHGLASTTNGRVLLPLPEHKPCDQQVEVQCLHCQNAHGSVPAESEVHSCLIHLGAHKWWLGEDAASATPLLGHLYMLYRLVCKPLPLDVQPLGAHLS